MPTSDLIQLMKEKAEAVQVDSHHWKHGQWRSGDGDDFGKNVAVTSRALRPVN